MKGTLLTAAVAALLASPALGGQIVKNGGAIVQGSCYPGATVTELLDFYEAKILRNWTIALTGATVEDKLDQMFARLAQIDPERAAVLQGWRDTFDAERGWLANGAELPTVNDIGEISEVLPNSCFIRQAAGQRIPDNPPFDPYYLFSRHWFDALDTDSQAGLIMHELIYRDGVRRGHHDSIGTRFLTSLLATDLVDRGVITPDVYTGILFRNGFDSYSHDRLRYYPDVTVATPDEARAFCETLTPDVYLVRTYGERLEGPGLSVSLSAFKQGAIARLLFTRPAAERLFMTVQGSIQLTADYFLGGDAINNLPSSPLCYVNP